MAVSPPFTAYHDTPNKSVRQNAPRRGVVLHHAAMTNLDALRALEMGLKEVSSTAIVKDDKAEQMLDANRYRAWSLSNAWGDSSFRSVETCNESLVGYTISEASHKTLARVVAYWAQLDGFWPHRDGKPEDWTVIGHREFYSIYGLGYATACPGGMNLDYVTDMAQQLLTDTPAIPVLTPWEQYEKDTDMYYLLMINDGEKRYGGGTIYALTGPNYWVEYRTASAANTLAARFGNAANVTYKEWDDAKAAATKK